MIPDWLPNIHPLIIHFPIAILIIAVLIDLLSLITGEQFQWLQKSAVLLHFIGVLSLAAAFISGHLAVETVNITASSYDVFEIHEEFALITLIYFSIMMLARFIVLYKHKIVKKQMLLIFFIAGIIGLSFLYKTAEKGGKLVFFYGIGTHQTINPSQ